MRGWLLGAALVMAPGVAAATIGVGARVGGYGFREASREGAPWDGCRMDGVGLFATLDLDRHFFGEAGLDFYQATDATVKDESMDRLSLHGQLALGVRLFPDAIVTPHLQLGGGVEWTKIGFVGTPLEREAVLASGFLGAGGELDISEQVHLGLNLRFLAMAGPDAHHVGHDEAIPLTYRAAGQLQFFLRYVL